MKFLLEFANFRQLSRTNNYEIQNKINAEFQNDTTLVCAIYIDKLGKEIFLKWYNSADHLIIDRIKSRTNFNSVSEFNDFVKKGFNKFFDKYLDKIKKEKGSFRYSLFFPINNFYMIFNFDYDNLSSRWTSIFVATISKTSDPNKVVKTFKMNYN